MQSSLKFFFLSLLILVSFEMSGQSGLYTVTGDNVNIRIGPGTNYSTVGTRKKGDTVTVIEMYNSEWAMIRVGASAAYINRQFITYKGSSSNDSIAQSSTTNETKVASKGLSGMSDKSIFWICFLSAIGLYLLSLFIAESLPFLSIFVNLLSAAALFIWVGASKECFWFLDFEKQNFLAWFLCYIVTAAFFGIIAGTAWENIKSITGLFRDFLPSFLCVVIGLVWGILLIRLVGVIFSEHPIICLLTLIGAIPSSHVPTIYVPGEGYITGHGYDGGSRFHGDNGYEYWNDGHEWHPD